LAPEGRRRRGRPVVKDLLLLEGVGVIVVCKVLELLS